MVQINEYNCIEIFLYCKPRHFLKKIFLTYDSILKYAKILEENVLSDEKSLKILFKKLEMQIYYFKIIFLNFRLAKKLYVRDDELFIKEIEFYPTLEDLIKSINKGNN